MSGPIRPPVRSSKGQSDVLLAIDHSVAGSMTAQPPGIRPSALRVATHGQQVASLGGLTPLQRCSRRILQPQPTGRDKKRKYILSHYLFGDKIIQNCLKIDTTY